MEFISLSDIVIEDRQRQVFDKEALNDLSKSIGNIGLLQPIVIRYDENGAPRLVAGERRLRAIQSFYDLSLPIKFQGQPVTVGEVPCIQQGDITTILAKEMELAENLYREDITWQERARAIAELHELRLAQNPEHTLRDTTREVNPTGKDTGGYVSQVSDAVNLHQFLDDEEVSKAKTQKEAVKIVKKKLAEKERAERAEEFSRKESKHKIHHADSLAWMDSYDGPRFDILLTDPPYGVGMDSVTSWDGSKHEYDDSEESFRDLMVQVFHYLPKVLKDDAHLYLFCDIKNWHWLAQNAAERLPEDFFVWPRPIIWYKGNIGAFPKPEVGPRYTYECILYITRGAKKTTGLYQDVIHVNQSTKQIHPAGKPVDLYVDLLKRSANPGDCVLDLFAGGGTIFPAAKAAYVTATGIEKSEKYYHLALERLTETGE